MCDPAPCSLPSPALSLTESVCNIKGLSQNRLGGHSPSDKRLGPLGQEAVGAGRRVGGGDGGEGRRFCCDARWEFRGLLQTSG